MLTDKKIMLDGEWRLYYAENRHIKAVLSKSEPICEKGLMGLGLPYVTAQVPGNFELDFLRAGIIDEPFYGCNTIELQKFENLHLFYVRKIKLSHIKPSSVLCFEGVDTIADIFVNGAFVGHTDNMLIPFELPTSNLHIGENEIVVHITPAHIAARDYPLPVGCTHQQFGYDSVAIRKAPHMYSWDIMPRALSGGIWRSCYIKEPCEERIDELFVWTHELSCDYSHAAFGFFWNIRVSEDFLSEYRLKFQGECDESKFETTITPLHTSGKTIIGIDCPKLWFPKNYGDPNLYSITVTLYHGEQPVNEYKLSSGLRTARLCHTSTTTPDGDGEFVFLINGQKVFWQGTNWVPVDAYHSRDRERLPQILPMLNDLGCNCVRCWGGNVYEDDIFYDFCDRNGIMVWQDFAHACGINPSTDEYSARFAHEAEAVVKRLRNHSSIVMWAGDNEVDLCYEWSGGSILRDPNTNLLTRRIIPEVLAMHDFTRPYLPSSPYIDEKAFEALSKGMGTITPEHHLWGPRDYFKSDYYKNAICHFASETGYHGCPSPESLSRFIRPEQLWHWQKYPDIPNKVKIPKDDWVCHAACSATEDLDVNYTRISLMSNQVKVMFKDFRQNEAGEGLYRFAMASQISQAEAKKYFIERFRMAKWRRTGIIWWNLIDGWPQISDAVVDYYGTKKLAYHYIKTSQLPLCLMVDEPLNGVSSLRAVSDLQEPTRISYRLRDIDSDKVYSEGELTIPQNSVCELASLTLPSEGRFLIIEWEYSTPNGNNISGKNHYVTSLKDMELDTYLDWMKKANLFCLFSGFSL